MKQLFRRLGLLILLAASPLLLAVGADNGKRSGEAPTTAPRESAAKAKPSAADEQIAIGVGSKIPEFTLKDAKSGNPIALSKLAGKRLTVLIFWNLQCPYVLDATPRIVEFQKAFADKGVDVVAVDAGVNNAPEAIAKHAEGLPFPLLTDATSKIASCFGASHTPEVFLLDKKMIVRYHGAFDSGQPGKSDPIRPYVQEAAESLLAGQNPKTPETKAFGCALRYAKGVKALPAVLKTPAKEKEA